ncbi:MAG: hypothetical protein EAX81_08210 [Candidatus Thorarchaeota archaeon]|nr:hypothetical protein [Candidatus Thorarchaeota archaeon]
MQDITPDQLGAILLLETISATIALLVSHYSNKAFRFTQQKRLADLSTGFLVLSAGMYGRVLGILYAAVSSNLETLTIVVIATSFMRIMAYVLFVVSTRHTISKMTPELVMFMQIPLLVDFNLETVGLILLVIVVLQSLMNYMSTRSRYGLYVLVGFVLLLLSHSAIVTNSGYLLSQILQLLAFLALLVMLLKVGREE